MKRLDSYIGKAVLGGALLAWLAVIALESLFALLGELGDIGRGDYGVSDALTFVLLTLPGRAYHSFPMAALVGALLGLGGLAARAELTAFGLAGCSPARLVRAVLQTGALMLVFVLAVGEGVAPAGEQLARQWRAAALFNDVGVQPDAGFWVRDGQRVIQIGQSAQDGALLDITVYELDSTPRLRSAIAISRARHDNDAWLLEDLRRSDFSDQGIEVDQSDSSRWAVLIDPRLATLLTRDAGTLSLPELGRYIAYLQCNASDVAFYRLAYWQRWAAPLSVLAMLLLAVSLVLGPLGRKSIPQRLLAGVAAGLVFKLFSDITAHAGLVYGFPPWASALLPSVAVLAAGVLLLKRYA